MICKTAVANTVTGDKQNTKVIQIMSAYAKIKLAAELHDDDEMILAMSGEDLVAKKFRCHKKCCNEFTRLYSKNAPKVVCTESSSVSSGDFEKLREFVPEHVVDGDRSVSMQLLTDVYGLNEKDKRV